MFPLKQPPPPSSSATDPKSRYEYAKLLEQRGLYEFAREVALKLVMDFPKFPGGHAVLIDVAYKQCDFVVAMSHAIKGVELVPNDVTFLAKAANSAVRSGFGDVAEDYAKRLVDAAPNEGRAYLQYSETLERINRGEESLEQALIAKELDPDCPWRLLEAKARLKIGQVDEAHQLLRDIFSDESVETDIRLEAGFNIVKLLDRGGDYDGAWSATKAAHALGKLPFDPNKRIKHVNKLIEAFSVRNLKLWRRNEHTYERAVFIVGMPRSGTSLLEQILQMHPSVGAVGELAVASTIEYRLQRELDSYLPYPKCLIDLLPGNISAMQDEYTRAIDIAASGKSRVVNKCLSTYEHLGLLSVVLPGMRAIQIKRHPLDNLLSCHTTNILASGHSYASTLEDLALMYRTRQKLARHWHESLDQEILQVSYEQLTADQENQSKRMIDFLGLEWDDRVLDFHKSKRVAATISYDQVNKKMYTTSVARWKNYEKHLGPLIDALGSELDDYET